jgi:hypothetical protein
MCGLVNPPTAQRCDCGYDFEHNRKLGSYLTENDRARLEETSEMPEYDGPFARYGAIAALLVYSNNGPDLVIASLAGLFAWGSCSAFGGGAGLFMVLFGLLAVGIDLGHRRSMIHFPLSDTRLASRFCMFPAWVVGTLMLALGGLLLLAQNA